MRIYNPQNQFGQDLITKNQVKIITGLEGLKGDKNIDQRLTAVENTAPSTALQTINGDTEDTLVKISFTKNGTTATADLTVEHATLTDNVISGDGIATGTQVALAIGKETSRATGVEDAIKADIGSWSSGSAYERSSVKAAIENISAITGFKIIDHRPVDEQDEGEKNTIYLYKPADATSYEEWIYVEVSAGNKKWEKIGDTDIKLTDYYKKSEIGEGFSTDNTVKDYVDAIKDIVDTPSATSTDNHVTVSLTGTVGQHGLTVSTSDIASATDLTALTTRVTTAEGKITTAEGKIATAEGKIATIVGKLEDLPEGTIKDAIDAAVALETTRATGVEGTLTNLTTDAKGNLVAAINEVDAHADAAQAAADAAQTAADNAQTAADNAQAAADEAQDTAEARLASIDGASAQGVSVQFTTAANMAVTTTITVTPSTLDANSKFATTDTAVATGAKVQAAIDAAEQRAKDAQTYTADGTTLQLSASNQFSAKTADVVQGGAALTTGGQVYTAIDAAKTALIGNTSITITEKTITKAIALAEAAQDTADDIIDGTKHAVGTMLELAVVAKADVDGTFTVTGVPNDVDGLHIVRVEWNHEDYMCKHDGNDVVLWNSSDVWPETATKPQASEIKVFALVTATTSVAG